MPFHARWSASASTGAWYQGSFNSRDTVVQANFRALDKPSLSWVVSPGASFPTGSAGKGLAFTPLSSGSVDPWLSTDLVVGGTWLAALSAQGRVSLYDGLDGAKQTPYGTVTLRGARRLGRVDAVPSVGVAASGAVDSFSELALNAGIVWAPNERWGLSADLRYPLVAEYDWAIGLGVRRVFGEGHGH